MRANSDGRRQQNQRSSRRRRLNQHSTRCDPPTYPLLYSDRTRRQNIPLVQTMEARMVRYTFSLLPWRYTEGCFVLQNPESLHLRTGCILDAPHINMWLELAMSRNVENLSLQFQFHSYKYHFPDFFYMNSSVKQLSVQLYYTEMIPRCSVSWTSLKKLSLGWCALSDESIAKILSGCPILVSLSLDFCHELRVLDLSKSLRLTTLQLVRNFWVQEPMQILAPHIHCLRLRNSQSPCTLVDVSSLAEAKLYMCFEESFQSLQRIFEGDLIEVMLQKMLEMVEKLQNVEKLAFGGDFLQIRGLIPDKCWRSKDGVLWNRSHWKVESKHVSSFMELMLNNTKTLEKMVVRLEEHYCKFKELVLTFFHTNNVSIVVSTNEW